MDKYNFIIKVYEDTAPYLYNALHDFAENFIIYIYAIYFMIIRKSSLQTDYDKFKNT